MSVRDHWQAFWIAVGISLALLLSFVLYQFIGTLVLGVFLYYASRPIYDRLRRRVRLPNVAAATALAVLVFPVVVLFWYTATLAVGELGTLAEMDLSGIEGLLPPYFEFAGSASDLRALFQSVSADPAQLLEIENLQQKATQFGSIAAQFAGAFLNGLLQLFIALAFAFYLLRDDDRLVDWTLRNFDDETLVTYGRAVDADLQTVFFGNILNALLTGVIGAVVFSGLAAVAPMDVPVPVPILLGLLTGAASLIPIIGMKIVFVPVTLYLAIVAVVADPQLLWFPAVFFLVTLVVVDMIPDLLIRPYVSGRNLHVGMVMFSYIFGPLVFGWYGLFLGPLLFVLLAHFARVVIPGLTGTDSSQTTITRDEASRAGTHTSPERGWYPTLTSETVTGQSSPSSGSGENRDGP